MRVLHIHQDYPDGLPYPSTKAVSNLIDACEEDDNDVTHFVLSINRTSNPFKIKILPFSQGASIIYWGIPIPFVFIFTMWLSSWWISRAIKGKAFNVIHGHKLTTEGYFASFLSKKYNIPYVVSIRGGSDCHNLSRLKVHKHLFSTILANASHVFWVSAWAKKRVLGFLGEVILKDDLLPNICMIDLNSLNQKDINKTHYVSAISLQQYKRKGILQLIEAVSILKKQGIIIYLDVYGGGDDTALHLIEEVITSSGLSKQIFLGGYLKQSELKDKIRDSRAFIMPSVNETFGMTYIEALSVGTPIVYLADTGIDGYFDDFHVGVCLSNQEPLSIVKAILYIEENLKQFQLDMQKMHDSEYLTSFTGKQVAKKYLNAVKGLV